ncbi:MAG: hypothetical protein V1901_04000 [Patescibacteria group bacterium]
MNLKEYKEDKIFVTGISCGGKTTIAKTLETPERRYISIDDTSFYGNNAKEDIIRECFKNLPQSFVIDGIFYIPSNISMNFDIFKEYVEKNEVKIICVIPTNFETWKQRVLEKQQIIAYSSVNFAMFYLYTLPALSKLNIDYYDTCTNEYIHLCELYKRIKWINPLLAFI